MTIIIITWLNLYNNHVKWHQGKMQCYVNIGVSRMGQTNGSETEQLHKAKNRKLLIGVICVTGLVIAILIGIIIYLLNKPSDIETPNQSTSNRATVVTEENVKEITEKVKEPVQDGYYNCQMNVEWNFTDSTQPSYNAYVVNSTINTRTVYFDVNIAETGELVYSSPYIPVGAELKDITLDVDLPMGDYPAIVTYHLVDDEQKELSTVSVSVTLHIEQ